MKASIAITLALLAFFCSADTVSHASIPPIASNPRHVRKPKPIIANTTCYYRVEKRQRRYATGSYRGDIRLNGTGITFSDKLVRVGHLAADLRYHPIGTRFRVIIDGEDHGIWTVEDKGSAIKGFNRFDFCAGTGDKGRALAESWGRGEGRVVKMYRVGKLPERKHVRS